MDTVKTRTPFQKFVKVESLSGYLLFGATILALILANSPWGEQFQRIWLYKGGLTTSGFELVKPLILWINDGLMAVFFFLIGLEIKRELMIGELNSMKKASFPLIAAIGGMLFPVLLFILLNKNPETAHAWGIPMATDIAFSLAILQLLGKRVPIGLKVFLTAFAIVDDLGAVMVIAVFYSSSIKWGLIVLALALLGLMFFLSARRLYSKGLTLIVGILIWYLFLKAGIHPTIAGVLLALTVPIRRKVRIQSFVARLKVIVKNIEDCGERNTPLLTRTQIAEIDSLEDWTEQVQSPLQHLEHKLHNWVAFLIMPLFAFSNAGVRISGTAEMDMSLTLIIMAGLVLGKLTGVTFMSWLAVRLKLAELPEGVNFQQIIGVALLAGVGFTMSIFVANLAFFGDEYLLDSAKKGILAGSFVAGVAGYLVLRLSGGNKKARQDEA